MAQNYINKIKVSNTEHLIEPTLYIAPTLSSSAYSANLDNFALVTGATVQAKFATTNPANATLNVNSTGAKDIFYNNAKITASQFKANHVYTLVYDGTQWQVVGDIDTNTWRGIQDNLTSSTNTTESLSAKQGYLLANGNARDNTKVPLVTSTDNAIVRFDGTSGAIQNSGVTIDDNNNITTTGSYIETAAGRFQQIDLLPGGNWSNYTNDAWYRCCKVTSKYGGYANFIIQFGGIWSTGAPTIATVSIQTLNTTITLLHCTRVGFIKAIRLVNNNGMWLDVQLSTNSSGAMGKPSATFIGNVVVSDIATAATITTDTTTPAATLIFRTTTDQPTFTLQDNDGTNSTTSTFTHADQILKLPSTIKASLTGNASTATEFSTTASIELTGDTTGSVSSKKGWSIATTTKFLSGVSETSAAITTSPGTGKIKYSYNVNKGTAGLFSINNNANSIITLNRHSGNYDSQLGFSSNGNIYYRSFNGSALDTTTAWEQIAFIDSTVARATADASGNTITSTYAPLASPALTGTPTAPTATDGTNTTQIATTAFVMSQFKYNDAMIYKGVVNANGDLPATHYQGWTYKVGTAGTYAGVACEIGDMIICNTDGTSANNAHWNVIQTNIDGAVIGPAAISSGRDNKIVRFDGETGKLIQDSKITIDDNGNLLISHAASATMTADSTNPKITFAESGTQPVHLIYSDYDSYRSPAGLKIIGGTSATPAWLEVEGNVYAAAFKGNADTATSATTATSLTNFVVSTCTIAAGKGVRIKYPSSAPVLISCQRSTGGSRLILIGGGYGEEGTVRNDFTELVSPAESHFTWSMPQTTGYACTIEIMHHDTSGTATVWVETTEACTFTEIAALTSTKTNRKLLHSSNYTDYTVTKTGSGASGSWGISITGSSASCTGNAETATTATNLSAAPTITQAGSSGTTLSAATFYTLTVGGQTVVFKTPTDTKNSAYGNINTSGQIGQTTNWALASGDALVVADSDNSWKLERTGITFDASTETECLTKKGTWKAFNNYSLPTAKNDTLGGVKPWYSHTAASTGPTTGSNATAITVNAIQTTAGRYYAVESDSNGRLFVNVPWTNVNSSYLTAHNNLVTQNVKTDNKKYGIILSNYETSASTTTAAAVNRDSKVYVNPSLNSVNAGQFVLHDKAATPVEKACMVWNATDQSIDFVFN